MKNKAMGHNEPSVSFTISWVYPAMSAASIAAKRLRTSRTAIMPPSWRFD